MNGSVGIVRGVTRSGAWIVMDDGAEDEIRPVDLERVAPGWAMSVHKAQGSAFRRVTVPVTRSRLLDGTLLYTALTRAVETCVLVGEIDLVAAVVRNEPRADHRRQSLDFDRHMEKGSVTPFIRPGPEAASKLAGRPSSRQVLDATERRRGQGRTGVTRSRAGAAEQRASRGPDLDGAEHRGTSEMSPSDKEELHRGPDLDGLKHRSMPASWSSVPESKALHLHLGLDVVSSW